MLIRWVIAAGLLVCAAASGAIAQSADSQEKTIVKEGIGCQSADFMLRMEKYVDQGDVEVIRREVLRAIEKGDCTLFRVGEHVYIADTSVYGPKLRRKGETEEFWVPFSVLTGTSTEATRQKPEAGSRTMPKIQRGGQ